jgi:hypothetical protein
MSNSVTIWSVCCVEFYQQGRPTLGRGLLLYIAQFNNGLR